MPLEGGRAEPSCRAVDLLWAALLLETASDCCPACLRARRSRLAASRRSLHLACDGKHPLTCITVQHRAQPPVHANVMQHRTIHTLLSVSNEPPLKTCLQKSAGRGLAASGGCCQ